MNNYVFESLRLHILPKYYRTDLSEKLDEGCMLFRKGSYVCLVMPFDTVPENDFQSKAAKYRIRSVMTCIPVLLEKGLFLIYYGSSTKWRQKTSRFTVNRTALRPVILQSIHFIDPDTGENVNSRTHWGPLKFGFCGNLIQDIESLTRSMQQGVEPDARTGESI